jgi:FtsX extracellular domain
MSIGAYFSRHAQVLVGSLGRVVNQPFATLMTMGVIAVALALPLFLILLLQNARNATGNWNEAYDLSVYMDKKAGAVRVQALAKQLRQRGDIATVRIITAEQALAEFRSDSGFGSALDALADNPLPDTLVVTPTLAASTPQGTESLKSAIAAMSDVQTVQIDTDWVKRLHAMLELLRRVVLLTGGLLGLGIVLIVSNTIRLDILNRRAEGHEAGGRFGRLHPPTVSLHRHLVWTGRRLVGLDAGRGGLDGPGAAGRTPRISVRQRLSLGGVENDHSGGRFGALGGAFLDRFLACCNAPYPSDRTGISICF